MASGLHLVEDVRLFCLICVLFLLAHPASAATWQVLVVDSSGAPVPGASVRLGEKGTAVMTGLDGIASLDRPKSGTRTLVVECPDFSPASQQIEFSTTTPSPFRVEIKPAALTQKVTVTDTAPGVDVDPSSNVDSDVLNREDLADLPIMGNDPLEAASLFLDDGTEMGGAGTIVVDGVEVDELTVPPSQIAEIRVNRNPYSAEFSRPGRGRIEITTRQATRDFHGELNMYFRDSALNARNAFADRRPDEQRRNWDGSLLGPLGSDGKTSFTLGVEREENDLQALVFARTPSELVQEQVPQPSRETELTLRVDRKPGEFHAYGFRYRFEREREPAANAGGFRLPEAVADRSENRHDLRISHTLFPKPGWLNEARAYASMRENLMVSRTPGQPQVVVEDAFIGGGAQEDLTRKGLRMWFQDVMSWSSGPVVIRTGGMVRGLTHERYLDMRDRVGIFRFSSLDSYLAGTPFAFTQQQGNGSLNWWDGSGAAFFQIDVRARDNLNIGAGIRYDKQAYIADSNNVAPRLSLAWSPGRSRKTVIRAGAGLFYDLVDDDPIRDSMLYTGMGLQAIQIIDPTYPDPFAGGTAGTVLPQNLVRLAPGLRTPYLFHAMAGVEREMSSKWKVFLNYHRMTGVSVLRARDLNAPLAGVGRPNPDIGVLRQIESSARMERNQLSAGIRATFRPYFTGTVHYSTGRTWSDSAGDSTLPANSLDLSREWAPEYRLHRLRVIGSTEAARWFSTGLIFTAYSGSPYSLTTGLDTNGDGFARDRPAGVGRNTLEGPGAWTVDLRLSRRFRGWPLKQVGGNQPTLKVSVDAFNLLNNVNYTSVVGNLRSPFFGMPVSARPARRMQISMRWSF